MKIVLFFAFLGINAPALAQTKDTIANQQLAEVVVTAQNHIAIKDGILYTPTPEERKLSSNYSALLSRMMMAGLRVDEFSNKVETNWGKEVHYFINGIEANDWELKTLRPKEVAHVEFLQSPSDPKYKNYEAVINFVLREYTYGGYVLVDGNQAFGNNNCGDYDIAGKLKKGHMTYQAILGAYYRNAHEILGNKDITYKYNDGSLFNKKVDYEQVEKQRIYSTGISVRYDSKKVVWVLKAGIKFSETPESRTLQNIYYSNKETASSISEGTMQSLVPYVSSQFVIYGLPRNSYAYGGISFSYNHNKGSNDYRLFNSESSNIVNETRENAYVPSLWLGYSLPVYKQNNLIFLAQLNSEIYRTNYYGTADTYQKLENTYYSFSLSYNHRFSDKWSGNCRQQFPSKDTKYKRGQP